MKKNMHKIFLLFLIIALIIPSTAMASEGISIETNRASAYITSYGSIISPSGNGEIRIIFSITGTGVMTNIGAMDIYLYEVINGSESFVRAYHHTSPSYAYLMMGHNKVSHLSSISYSGTAGRGYYAVIYFKCEDSTGYDTATFVTSTVTAN